MGKIRVGTSGFSYDAWYGSFYPEDLRKDEMLSYYAKHFDTCEINNTFYRMPTPKLIAGWVEKVPASFSFVLKASQKITHLKRLKDSADSLAAFGRAHAELGTRTGPVLFQLPPYLKKDVPRLVEFFALLPQGMRVALEFGSPTWLDAEVYSVLRDNGAALVSVDDEKKELAFEPTGTFAYARLRRPAYSDDDLARWADRVRGPSFKDGAYVFFKHEDEGKGPEFGKRFLAALER
jgi:uncharacterized protein YecE (DUF72 family)